jgi:hypothetical protein
MMPGPPWLTGLPGFIRGEPGRVGGVRRSGIPIVALLLIAVTAAGCGSSTSSSTTSAAPSATMITKAQFVAKANAICRKGNEASQAAGAKLGKEPREAEEVGFVTEKEVPAVQAQVDALKALGAPAGEEATVANIINTAQADLDKVKSEPTLVVHGVDVFANFAKIAHPYGLTSCAPRS